MVKEELKKLRTLKATPKMLEIAKRDKKESRYVKSIWGYEYRAVAYEYSLFLRCQELRGYLKVAVFIPDHMRCGSNMPAYEIFLHRDAGQYLTWDARQQKWLTAMIHNLPYMQMYGCHRNAWINPEGKATIKKYLGVEESGFEGIRRWQQKTKDEQTEARYKRMTDPWDADMALVPELPTDWEDWVRRVAVREWYVFYETGAQTGYCTFCNAQVPIGATKHNKKTVCTCCGNNVTYKNTNRMKYLTTRQYNAYLMQKVEGGMVVRTFGEEIVYRKDNGWRPRIIDREARRAFYDLQGKHRATYHYEWFRNREMRFVKVDSYWLGYGSPSSGAVYGMTLPALHRSVLKHTGYATFRRKGYTMNPEWYMAVYNRYPQVELLLKADLPALTRECLANCRDLEEAINPNIPGSLAKKMHLDESRLKRLRASKGGMCTLRWLRYEKNMGLTIPDEEIAWLDKNCLSPQRFHFLKGQMRITQICRYMRKQMELAGMNAGELLTTWKDTLDMSEKAGRNINDPYIYRPSKLKQRHDELVLQSMMKNLQKSAEKNRKDYPLVEPVLAGVKDVFSYVGEKYCVVVPETILDIMVEGQNLSHCVGSSTRYLDRIERRESYVMFLRKAEAPEQSYYTLEVEPDGTVRQKRTYNDRQQPDIEDATKFLKQWQKEVSKRLTDQDRALAKKSKELRLQGFEQMRRDHVVIRTGDLRGRMLVDVLMADLMENKEEKTA